MPISCHFQDCKALLVLKKHARSAIASTWTLPLPLAVLYLATPPLAYEFCNRQVQCPSIYAAEPPSTEWKNANKIITKCQQIGSSSSGWKERSACSRHCQLLEEMLINVDKTNISGRRAPGLVMRWYPRELVWDFPSGVPIIELRCAMQQRRNKNLINCLD